MEQAMAVAHPDGIHFRSTMGLGLRLEITTAQVREQAKKRAEYHRAKAKWYTERAEEAKALDAKLGSESLQAPGGYASEYLGLGAGKVQRINNSAQHHEGRARWFETLGAHIQEDQVFVCDSSMISHLEFDYRGEEE